MMFRYYFETNKERFLPTVTFSGGPAEVSIRWPNSIDQIPSATNVNSTDLSSNFQCFFFVL